MDEQPRLFDFTEKGEGAGAFIVADSNRQAIGLLKQWRSWPGGALALVGPEGSGKSHLARLWAGEAGALVISGKLTAPGAREAFAARDGRLVLDNADRAQDDSTLMLVLDLARSEGGAVLLVGRETPAEWRAELPDLRSRFSALLTVGLGEPDEKLIIELIRRLCRARFIEMKENVAKYAAQHMERSFAAAHALVSEIDNLMTEGSQPVPYDIAAEALRRLERQEHERP
jgi:chromosomal replication initiation ATPase DnaA